MLFLNLVYRRRYCFTFFLFIIIYISEIVAWKEFEIIRKRISLFRRWLDSYSSSSIKTQDALLKEKIWLRLLPRTIVSVTWPPPWSTKLRPSSQVCLVMIWKSFNALGLVLMLKQGFLSHKVRHWLIKVATFDWTLRLDLANMLFLQVMLTRNRMCSLVNCRLKCLGNMWLKKQQALWLALRLRFLLLCSLQEAKYLKVYVCNALCFWFVLVLHLFLSKWLLI